MPRSTTWWSTRSTPSCSTWPCRAWTAWRCAGACAAPATARPCSCSRRATPIDDRVAGLDAGRGRLPGQALRLAGAPGQAARAAAARRARGAGVLRFADLELDPVGARGAPRRRRIELSRTEFTLLELFLAHPRQVLTRSEIFERVWGYDFGSTLQRPRRLRRLSAPQDGGARGSRGCSTPCAASATSCARGRPDPAPAARADHRGDRRRDGGGRRRRCASWSSAPTCAARSTTR